MQMISLKIAWRNLRRHQSRSLVIGCILFFGALVMSIGNGIISGMEQGLSVNVARLFTGDIIVVANDRKKNDVLFGTGGKPLNVISDFPAVKKAIGNEPQIQRFLPSAAGAVMILTSDSQMGALMVLGVNIGQYRRMFPQSITVTGGRMLAPGQRGVLVSEASRKYVYDFMNFWLLPEGITPKRNQLPVTPPGCKPEIRRELILMGVNPSASMLDVRAPIRGVIRYKALNRIWGNYCIMDIESFREAYGYLTNADSQVELTGKERQLFDSDSLDSYFASGNMVKYSSVEKDAPTTREIQRRTKRSKAQMNSDSGAYNLVFIKLKPGCSLPKAIHRLNLIFAKKRMNVRAIGWKAALGTVGSMSDMYKGMLNLFIGFLFFVAGIVIMNTLIMTALERVSEFAMMRAVGAQKGFLRKMFIYETGSLFFCFGGLGIVTGMMILGLLNVAHITTTNEFLQMIFGGDQFHPLITSRDIIMELMELGMMACFSVLYPLRVVARITPLDAMARD